LVEVPLNELENSLLEIYLDKPEECAPKVTDLLRKVQKRV
jgi:hypothetical protein